MTAPAPNSDRAPTAASGRDAELLAALIEFAVTIERWSCDYWTRIAPGSGTRPRPVLTKGLSRFSSGDPGVSATMVVNSLQNVRNLVTAMMLGISEGGDLFATDHLSRFGVDSIRAAAQKKMLEPEAVSCWKQYCKMMEDLGGEALARRVMEPVGERIESTYKGLLLRDNVLT